jgi:hypothetical protein
MSPEREKMWSATGWQVWMTICEPELLRGLTAFLLGTSAIASFCARECRIADRFWTRISHVLRDVGQDMRSAAVRRR